MHFALAGGDQHGRDIVFPAREIFAVQGLKQVFNQLGCYPALAGKNPEGVCSLARPFNAGFIERALGFHRIADLLQQIFRTANAVFTQGKQEVSRVDGQQLVGLAIWPQGDAVAVETAADCAKRGLDYLVALSSAACKTGPILEQGLGKGLADQLFGAAIRIGIEIFRKTTRKRQGHGGDNKVAVSHLRVNLAVYKQIG